MNQALKESSRMIPPATGLSSKNLAGKEPTNQTNAISQTALSRMAASIRRAKLAKTTPEPTPASDKPRHLP
ncbi:MAG: hypothetical protein U0R52_13170 [Solirubrobacterales bacterium]